MGRITASRPDGDTRGNIGVVDETNHLAAQPGSSTTYVAMLFQEPAGCRDDGYWRCHAIIALHSGQGRLEKPTLFCAVHVGVESFWRGKLHNGQQPPAPGLTLVRTCTSALSARRPSCKHSSMLWAISWYKSSAISSPNSHLAVCGCATVRNVCLRF